MNSAHFDPQAVYQGELLLVISFILHLICSDLLTRRCKFINYQHHPSPDCYSMFLLLFCSHNGLFILEPIFSLYSLWLLASLVYLISGFGSARGSFRILAKFYK